MAYATVIGGSISGITSVNVSNWDIVQDVRTQDVTNATTTGTQSEFATGRVSYSLTGDAFYYTGGAYPKPIEVTVSGSLVAKLARVQITKMQMLSDVTNAATPQGEREYIGGKIKYRGTALGWLQTTDSPLESETVDLTAFTIPLSATASVVADARIRRSQYGNRTRSGGGVLVPFDFWLTGAVTLNGTNPLSDNSYTADITVGNSQDWNGSVIVQRQEIMVDYKDGLPTVMRYVLPFNGTVTRATSGA